MTKCVFYHVISLNDNISNLSIRRVAVYTIKIASFSPCIHTYPKLLVMLKHILWYYVPSKSY